VGSGEKAGQAGCEGGRHGERLIRRGARGESMASGRVVGGGGW